MIGFRIDCVCNRALEQLIYSITKIGTKYMTSSDKGTILLAQSFADQLYDVHTDIVLFKTSTTSLQHMVSTSISPPAVPPSR
jgi:hypothetical protein